MIVLRKDNQVIFLTKFNPMQSLKLLSVMSALRLDDGDTDDIEKTLAVALLDSSSGANRDRSITVVDPLASSTWEQVHFYCCYLLVLSDELVNYVLFLGI